MTCIGKDPRCPCQDGDACHYKDCGGTKAWPVPQAEPVLCRFCHSKKGCYTWLCYSCGEIDDVQQPAAQPVQKPLTHDEIEAIGDKVANEQLVGPVANFRVRFARAIEAAHGIKEKT